MERRSQFVVAMPSVQRLFTPGVSVLLACMVGSSILSAMSGGRSAGWLGISTDGLLHGRLWQLFSYGWVHSLQGLLMSALVLLFLGTSVEREWKTGPFLLLWATVTGICGILWCVVTSVLGMPAIGTGGMAFTFGLLTVYGYLFRRRKVQLFMWPMESQHMVLLFLAIGVLMSLRQPLSLVWVAGAGVGWLYVKLLQARQDRQATPQESPEEPRKGFVDLD